MFYYIFMEGCVNSCISVFLFIDKKKDRDGWIDRQIDRYLNRNNRLQIDILQFLNFTSDKYRQIVRQIYRYVM